MMEAGWDFVQGAGTLIVAVTILVWAAAYFPRSESVIPQSMRNDLAAVESQIEELPEGAGAELAELEDRQRRLSGEMDALYLENSFLARGGRMLTPVTSPLGWDWRITSGVVAAFPAREVVVSTFGVIFGLGGDVDEESLTLRDQLIHAKHNGSDKPLFTLPVALGLMVFFALCAQCVSTLATIKRETGSWRWPIVSFTYMTVLAWIGAFVTVKITGWIWPGM
jgi:ferrous iron transport protein B